MERDPNCAAHAHATSGHASAIYECTPLVLRGYNVLKALLSGVIIAAASEVARRSSLLGAIIVSLPLTSLLTMIWLWRDTHERDEIADLSWPILWVIVPSLALFVVLPLALRSMSFWPALLVACAITAVCYGAWVFAAEKLGVGV